MNAPACTLNVRAMSWSSSVMACRNWVMTLNKCSTTARPKDALRIFHFSHTPSPADRIIGEIPTGLICDYPRSALPFRKIAGQIALAGALIEELDRPENGRSDDRHSIYTDFPAANGDAARVVYLSEAKPVESLRHSAWRRGYRHLSVPAVAGRR
jgi:hypothetical protein